MLDTAPMDRFFWVHIVSQLECKHLDGGGVWWRMRVWSVSARVGWNIPEDPLDGLEWGPKLRETMACFSLL